MGRADLVILSRSLRVRAGSVPVPLCLRSGYARGGLTRALSPFVFEYKLLAQIRKAGASMRSPRRGLHPIQRVRSLNTGSPRSCVTTPTYPRTPLVKRTKPHPAQGR